MCAGGGGSGPENFERFLRFLFSGPFPGVVGVCVCAAGTREGALQTRPHECATGGGLATHVRIELEGYLLTRQPGEAVREVTDSILT